jgi:hypothetical protein
MLLSERAEQLAWQAVMELFLVVLAAVVAGAIWAATRDRRRRGSESRALLRPPVKASGPTAKSRNPRASAGQVKQ